MKGEKLEFACHCIHRILPHYCYFMKSCFFLLLLFVTVQTNGFPNICEGYVSVLFPVGYEEFCIMGHNAAWYLLHTVFLLSLFFDPEDGSLLPRNVG
jgi:hypothetical protein